MDTQLNTRQSGRQAVPDILKCICCVCVIVIHTASQSMTSLNFNTFNWFSATFWGSLCRPAVPVFLMVSGALLYDPARQMSLRHIYEHYFLRILLCLFFWSFMYELYTIAGFWILYRQFDPVWFLDAVKNVLFFDHHFHLYYLQILLIFYIFLPLTRVFTAHADRATVRYMLIVWFALGIVLPCLAKYPPLSKMSGIPAEYPLSMTYSALGYGLMGWYLKTAEIKRSHFKRYLLIFIGGFAIVYGMTIILSISQCSLNQDFLDGFTPGVALMAIGLYGGVTALFGDRSSESMPKTVWFSKASFCVYLVHHFFVMLQLTYLYFTYKYFCLLVIPLEAAGVLALSLLCYVILRRIPWVKDHLI